MTPIVGNGTINIRFRVGIRQPTDMYSRTAFTLILTPHMYTKVGVIKIQRPMSSNNSVTCMCDYRRGLDWWMELLTTYTHESQIRTSNYNATANLHKSSQHRLRIFQPAVFTSRSLATASNSGDSSRRYCPANIPQLKRQLNYRAISSQPPLQNSTGSSETKAVAEAYCRQPAGTLTPGIRPRWDPWPYIFQMSRTFVSFSFRWSSLLIKEGLVFFVQIGVRLLHPTPPEVTIFFAVTFLVIASRHVPHRKHLLFPALSVAPGTCLPNRWLVTVAAYSPYLAVVA
jgi:hypothetical protein